MSKLLHHRSYDPNQFYSVVDGISYPIEAVKDVVFSQKMMGNGIAITPASSIVRAPCSGTLTTVFPTGHAFGITRTDGIELLVHIGLNTVDLKGKGFKILKKQNQKVSTGEGIIEIDLAYLSSRKMDPTILVVFLDTKDKEIMLQEPAALKCASSIIAAVALP